MLFEFINPSDPYHFEAPDLEIATVVTFILGEGRGAAHQVDAEDEDKQLKVPIFLFGGAEKWVQEQFGKPLEEFFEDVKKNRRQELIQSLESVTIGSLEDYRVFWKTMNEYILPEKREAYKKSYHDGKLTSMNDFGSYAWGIAKNLKKTEGS
jgi:hypothetical protein